MKNISKIGLALVIIGSNTSAMADVGNGQVLGCKNTEKQTFGIVATAVPTLQQGQLDLNQDGRYQLTCKRGTGQTRGTQPHVLWNCIEDRPGEGRVVVRVEQGGLTGLVTAYVTREQMFPLAPKSIGLPLTCQSSVYETGASQLKQQALDVVKLPKLGVQMNTREIAIDEVTRQKPNQDAALEISPESITQTTASSCQ